MPLTVLLKLQGGALSDELHVHAIINVMMLLTVMLTILLALSSCIVLLLCHYHAACQHASLALSRVRHEAKCQAALALL